jgi:hypothetical protein
MHGGNLPDRILQVPIDLFPTNVVDGGVRRVSVLVEGSAPLSTCDCIRVVIGGGRRTGRLVVAGYGGGKFARVMCLCPFRNGIRPVADSAYWLSTNLQKWAGSNEYVAARLKVSMKYNKDLARLSELISARIS